MNDPLTEFTFKTDAVLHRLEMFSMLNQQKHQGFEYSHVDGEPAKTGKNYGNRFAFDGL